MKERIIKNKKVPKSLFNIIPMVKGNDGIYKVKKHNFGEIDFDKIEKPKRC